MDGAIELNKTHKDDQGCTRCSPTLLLEDSDGFGVIFSSIKETVRDLD